VPFFNLFIKSFVYFRKLIFVSLVFSFLFVSSLLAVDESFAQIPKPAQPELFEKRFEKPVTPKSTLEPVVPEYKEPPAPSKMEELTFILTGIVVEGSTVYTDSDFLPYYGDYLGQEISLAKVYEFAQAITARYRNDGYLLSKAIVPSQRIQSGIVRLQIIEGFINDIEINGQVEGRMKRLWAYGDKIVTSRPLQAKVLERYLLLINDLPGIKVESVLTPSETTPGAAILTLFVQHKTVDGFLSLDNRGSQFNGPIQGSFGGNLNSLFGLEERTGFNFVTSGQSELLFFSGNHEQQIGSQGTKVILSGNLSLTEPGSTLEVFKVKGKTSTISMLIFHPFIRTRKQNLSGSAGFYARDTETELLGSVTASDRLRVFNLGFSYDFVDRFRGVSLLSMEFSQGANILDATESGNSLLSRAQGKSDFSKFSANMWRRQSIAAGWSVLAEASGQYSFDSLLASEEFGFGGARFGRGYDSSEITGDQGVAVKAELQYFHKIAKKYLRDLQAYAFYDYGSVWQKGNDFTGSDRHSSLSSAGGGIRLNLTDWLSGYVEAAKPLDDRVIGEGNKDFRGFASLIARF
jgi:hemolysin activation/secretion protein